MNTDRDRRRRRRRRVIRLSKFHGKRYDTSDREAFAYVYTIKKKKETTFWKKKKIRIRAHDRAGMYGTTVEIEAIILRVRPNVT